MAAMITFVLLAMIVFLIIVTNNLVSTQEQKLHESLQHIVDIVENEVETAAIVQDGYVRSFKLPEKLRGKPYTFEFWNSHDYSTEFSEVVAYYNESQARPAIATLPGIAGGYIMTGTNEVRKLHGKVFVNCGDEVFEYTEEGCRMISSTEAGDSFNGYATCGAYLSDLPGIINEGESQLNCNVCCHRFGLCCPPDAS